MEKKIIEFIPLWDRRKRSLTKRMTEIKSMRLKNKSYKEISKELGISPSTVNVTIWKANKRERVLCGNG